MRPHRFNESRRALAIIVENRSQRLFALDFDLAIRPPRDLYDGVDDSGIVLVWVERDLAHVVSKMNSLNKSSCRPVFIRTKLTSCQNEIGLHLCNNQILQSRVLRAPTSLKLTAL